MDRPYPIRDRATIRRLMDEEPTRIDAYEEATVYHYEDGSMGVYNHRTTTTEWLSWYPQPSSREG